jgi:hypothetical protein
VINSGLSIFTPKPSLALRALLLMTIASFSCTQNDRDMQARESTSQPAEESIVDTTLPKSMPARDLLERQALDRDPGLRLVDKLMDKRTAPPPMDRS